MTFDVNSYPKAVRPALAELRPDQQEKVAHMVRSWNRCWWPEWQTVERAIKKVRNNNP